MNLTQIRHYFLNEFGFWEIFKTVVIVASCLPNLVLAFKILTRPSTHTLFNIRKLETSHDFTKVTSITTRSDGGTFLMIPKVIICLISPPVLQYCLLSPPHLVPVSPTSTVKFSLTKLSLTKIMESGVMIVLDCWSSGKMTSNIPLPPPSHCSTISRNVIQESLKIIR